MLLIFVFQVPDLNLLIFIYLFYFIVLFPKFLEMTCPKLSYTAQKLKIWKR